MISIDTLRAAPALSIRQPWAELIVSGKKDVELRFWKDNYRGPVWLHTGAQVDERAAAHFQQNDLFKGGLVGVARLTEIRLLTQRLFASWRDRHLDFSDFTIHRELYGWVFTNICRLPKPYPCKGALKLFAVDTSGLSDDALQGVAAQFDGTSHNH
ncbi:ASCH domain-containing protein [Rhizobium leguminosarum]|uniref:ASCH domain-containing protein n=1 Tax=Rhizobium leguminosarum TaxID=384 RepID=UPI001C94AFFE|nr:ASCH domain-containing protein [Rhizobium leguminosarum]MBY5731498.1 ASCH domain-containing protein [Rhizobium leguminosarum]